MVNREKRVRRKEYLRSSLDAKKVDRSPFRMFSKWFRDAERSGLDEPNAFALATAARSGAPSVRMLLLKGFSTRGFVFYTNYQSRKGGELKQNPKAAMLFYWEDLERQVRIKGRVRKVTAAISDRYFRSRPRGAQAAACISQQSAEIQSREVLESAWREMNAGKRIINRPPQWGGYILEPDSFEFWQGGRNRLHDRIFYMKRGALWRISRLAP